jgi:hypothetical protein
MFGKKNSLCSYCELYQTYDQLMQIVEHKLRVRGANQPAGSKPGLLFMACF